MLQLLLKVSRPRFWMYTIGPYLIGIGAALDFNTAALLNPSIWLWLLYFSFPANLFIYGLNDIADTDTDTYNQKKGTYEAKVENKDKRLIVIWTILLTLPFIPLVLASSKLEQICFVIFILFGAFYSLPPVRFKAIPFADSLSNGVLYTMAGIMGYAAAGGTQIAWVPYIAAFLWPCVMHAYSAIPDIKADTKAGIQTIATVLQAKGTLIYCAMLYAISAVLLFVSGNPIHALLVLPYFILISVSAVKLQTTKDVFSVYKIYPYITYVVGALVYAANVNF